MTSSKKLKRIRERNFSAHHMLIRVASRANERAKKREPGWMYEELTAMTFSALAIEALCNSIGSRVFADWDDFESSSPTAKLRLLADRLGIKYAKDKEPWATALWLVKFRNLIAHAKPEVLVEEQVINEEDYDERVFDAPQSKFERWITPQHAARAVRGAQKIKDVLIGGMKPEDTLGLATDGWSGSTSVHNDV